MTPEQTLHTFARRYLMERSDALKSEYSVLASAGRHRRGYDYTPKAYNLFPRYNVLDEILLDVEMLDFDQLPNFDDLIESLASASQTGAKQNAHEGFNPTARAAEGEERAFFLDAIRSAATNGALQQERLPYRRTLTADEVDELWRRLRDHWGVTEGYWFPLTSKTHPSLVAFELDRIDETALQLRFKKFFKDHRIRRIFELREFGRANYCVEAGFSNLYYGPGGEGFWTSDERDWIVYCSHETTITLGGTITAVAPQGHFRPV